MRIAARRRSAAAPRGRATTSAIRAARRARSRALMPDSLPGLPVEIGAHARPQLRHGLDWIGADREGSKIEITGRARGAPARIFALGRDQLDLDRHDAVAERGN